MEEAKTTESSEAKNAQVEVKQQDSFLIFEVGNNLYGTPLLSVREVLEKQPTKPVPYAPNYFLGIMNLRGRVVSVIDLRKKFNVGVSEEDDGQAFIMILDLEDTSIGVVIDRVISVQNLSIDDVSFLPTIDTHIDPEYLIGAARFEDKLITLVELSKLIDKHEVDKYRNVAT
jgi:purine-binding chemotaxis protein CheW